MSKKHDHNGIYTREQTCKIIHRGISEKFSDVNKDIDENKQRINNIESKLNKIGFGVAAILAAVVVQLTLQLIGSVIH